MAKDKIKCKKCRKSFEPDLYSGLCPKCGTYNGRHMDTSALDLYISGRQQAEKEHRELHEKYDQGYDQAHPKYDTAVKDYDHNEKAALLQEARESFQNRQKKETLLNGKPLQKSPFQRFVKLLFITVIIMAIMTVVMVLYSNMAMVRKTEANVTEVVEPSVSGSVIFDHELLEAPIELSVLNAGMVQELDGLSGKGLYAVTVYSGSEEYSFDAEIEDVLSHAVIIEDENEASGRVGLGCIVVVRDVATGTETEYRITGSQEANPMENKLSDDSPFGRAIVGKAAGETFTVNAPMGAFDMVVVSITREG